jgi:clan AA aspartic protease (TIGR02281 family)
MKKLTLLILIFSTCLSASWLEAQSIADAAKKERQRRERTEEGKTFTETDLKSLSGRSNITTGMPSKGASNARTARATEVMSIPFERRGSTMIVTVELNERVETRLAVDTGASITSVSQFIASSLGLKITEQSRTIRMQTANGIIMAPLAKLNSLRVGEIEITDLDITVIPNWGDTTVTGLLGMNFLNLFDWSTDGANNRLLLKPLSASAASEGNYGGYGKDWWAERFRALHTARESLEAELKWEERRRNPSRVAQIKESIERIDAQLDLITRQADEAGVPKAIRK